MKNWYDLTMQPGDVVTFKYGAKTENYVVELRPGKRIYLVNMETKAEWNKAVHYGASFADAITAPYVRYFEYNAELTEELLDMEA